MADKLYKVAGFTFTDEVGAKEALKEQKTIEYIESRTNMKDPKMVNKVYHQIVDQNMFHTPVGFAYINKLKYMLEDISGENAENMAVTNHKGISKPQSAKSTRKTTVNTTNTASSSKAGVDIKVSERTVDTLEDMLASKDKIISKYKALTTLFAVVAFVLLVSVGAMFYITSTIGSPTILNYEEELINKYASWEQQLIERENAVLIRERELKK